VIAGQEGFRIFVDLKAGVGDQRPQFPLAGVRPDVAVGELGGRGAVTAGGRSGDLLAGGEALAGLGERLGQGQALLLVQDLGHVGLGAI
jgi:hypothetical protein